MCEWGTDVIVTLAHPLPQSGRMEVAVDACLAPLVQLLNDYGVHTVACCCGHGKGPGQITYEQDGVSRDLQVGQQRPLLTPDVTQARAERDHLDAACVQQIQVGEILSERLQVLRLALEEIVRVATDARSKASDRNQPPSGLRGDPIVPRTVNDEARDKGIS